MHALKVFIRIHRMVSLLLVGSFCKPHSSFKPTVNNTGKKFHDQRLVNKYYRITGIQDESDLVDMNYAQSESVGRLLYKVLMP